MYKFLLLLTIVFFSSYTHATVLCSSKNIDTLVKLESVQKCIINEINKIHEQFKETESYNKNVKIELGKLIKDEARCEKFKEYDKEETNKAIYKNLIAECEKNKILRLKRYTYALDHLQTQRSNNARLEKYVVSLKLFNEQLKSTFELKR